MRLTFAPLVASDGLKLNLRRQDNNLTGSYRLTVS
jgi:hypothetical protein